MNINLPEIIGLAGAALVIALGLFFAENIKSVAQHYFSNRSKSQINNTYYFVLVGGVLLFLAVAYLGGFEKNSDTDEIVTPQLPQPPQKTVEAEYVEAGKVIIDLATEAYEDKKQNDSIIIANKEKIWACQIGTPKKWDAAWDLYEKVKQIDGICFFKISRNEYLVVKYNGDSEENVKTTMNNLLSEIDNIGEKIQVIDLMSFCSKKEKVVEQKKLRNKKKDFEVRLYECEK